MAGTMEHLIRILEDMTNAIERLGMIWKEESLAVVAGHYAEYKVGDKIMITSSKGRRWEWRVVEGLEALVSWLDVRICSESSLLHRLAKVSFLFYAQKSLLCDPKIPSRDVFVLSTLRVWQQHCMVQENGLTLNQCSRHFVSGS